MVNQSALPLIQMPARTESRMLVRRTSREYPVTRCFDQVPSMFFDTPLCGPIMLIEQMTPRVVSHLGGAMRGINNIRE